MSGENCNRERLARGSRKVSQGIIDELERD